MSDTGIVGGMQLEREVRLLRERERGLRYLSQSKCCTLRPEAELELIRVCAKISSTFEQIRCLQRNSLPHTVYVSDANGAFSKTHLAESS